MPKIQPRSTAVFDNRRRGVPRPGCDCVRCFGYCMIDGDEAVRQRFVNYRAPKQEEGKDDDRP